MTSRGGDTDARDGARHAIAIVIALVATSSCKQILGIESGVVGVGTDAAFDSASGNDQSVARDAQLCWSVPEILVSFCLMAPPIFTTSASQVLDTNPDVASSACLASDNDSVCVVAGERVVIADATILSAIGSRPLVLLATSELEVAGTIDVASHRGSGQVGAAARSAGCNSGTAPATAGGGGQAGSFGGVGGDGGDQEGAVNSRGIAGASLDTSMVGLRGGCPGARGGRNGGAGGAGGGAVLLMSNSIVLRSTAVVNASGAAGQGGNVNNRGGGGGGSGGTIVFVSSSVTAAGDVFANGGPGGGGSSSLFPGRRWNRVRVCGVGRRRRAGGRLGRRWGCRLSEPVSQRRRRRVVERFGRRCGGGGGAGAVLVLGGATLVGARVSPSP